MQSHSNKKPTIILIGCEDSTCAVISKSIASHLSMPFLDLQELCQQYFDETDYDENLLEQAWRKDGMHGVYHYMQPYDIHAIKRGVEEHHNCVIRFGALQAVLDDADELRNVRDYLKPFSVVLLQPVEDKNESIRLVQRRNSNFIDGKELNEYFLTHSSNFVLAKQTAYTKDKTPEQTAEDILSQLDTDAKETVLIGAISVGKSTIGKLLSQELGIPLVSMDQVRWRYYEDNGWNQEEQQAIAREEGFIGVYRYWKPFEVNAVERIVCEHKHSVIDLGAAHSVHDNADDFNRVAKALAPISNVVHILPSPDQQESIDILHKRRAKKINGVEIIEFLLSHPSYDELSDHVVYTEGKTLEQARDAVLEQLGLEQPGT